MASPVKSAAWLAWIDGLLGGASRQTCAAAFPPDRYYCLLDELPLQLIPKAFLESSRFWELSREPLFLNPDCRIAPAGEPPPEFAVQEDILAGFAFLGTIAWVRDAAWGTMLPFWLGPTLEEAVQGLQPGEPAPAELDEEAVRLLAAAGILVPEGRAPKPMGEWNETIIQSATLFQTRDYVPLRNLMHPFHVAALRRYYRHLIRRGMIHLGDQQSSRRYVAYNEPVARFFHRQMAGVVSAVAGQPVKPSYVYLASYLSGAELKKHTDRPQCEFSVTLCLDFSPEPQRETSWPIHLDTPQGKVTVHQALGDGLAYRGTRVPHYRDPLAEGQTSTSVFFHYVSEDFSGSLD